MKNKILYFVIAIALALIVFSPYLVKAQTFDSLPNISIVHSTDKMFDRQVGATSLKRMSVEQFYQFITHGGATVDSSQGMLKIPDGYILIGGTNGSPSAIVDMQSTDKGLLIPRMSAAQMAAIVSPATGLIIYNTSVNAFHFYNGSAWIEIGSGAGGTSGWSLTGDSISSSDFLGTTNDENLLFKRNNRAYGYLASKNIALGDSAGAHHGAGDYNIFFGYGAGQYDAPSGASENVMIGHNAGYVNAGNYNSFIGTNAGVLNTTGTDNVFVGDGAGSSNTTGEQNVFIGPQTGNTASGSYNILFGVASHVSTDSTDFGIGLGYGCYTDNYGIALGFNAIALRNELHVSDSVTALHLLLNGGSTGDALVTDGFGVATWQTISGGSGSPYGNGVQYSSSGSFYSDVDFTRDSATKATNITASFETHDSLYFRLNPNIFGMGIMGLQAGHVTNDGFSGFMALDGTGVGLSRNGVIAGILNPGSNKGSSAQYSYDSLSGVAAMEMKVENGSNSCSVKIQDTTGAKFSGNSGGSYSYTFPKANGTAGQTLLNNGSGYLYWGSAGGGGGSSWDLAGNAGINASTQFIGTTNVDTLNFKVNGVKAGIIDGVQNNTSFGKYALGSTVAGGGGNSAFGMRTLPDITTGTSNTAMGYAALFRDTSGGNNVGIGYAALSNIYNGAFNVGIGYYADALPSVNYSIILGEYTCLSSNQLVISNHIDSLHLDLGTIDVPCVGCALINVDGVGSAKWIPLDTSGSGWGLSGNNIISDTLNFLGTTGYGQDLVFKVENTQAGRLEGMMGGNSTFGYNAGLYLGTLTSGYNSLFGFEAGHFLISGTENVAIGPEALAADTAGKMNIAIGSSALQSIQGDKNIGIGTGAGNSVQGAFNVFLGYGTNMTFAGFDTMSNAVAIGANSNAKDSSIALGSDALVIIPRTLVISNFIDSIKAQLNGGATGDVLTYDSLSGYAKWKAQAKSTVAFADSLALTVSDTVITTDTTVVTGTYRVGGYLTVSANTGTITISLMYVDQNGNAASLQLASTASTGTIKISDYQIRAYGGTAITIYSTVTATGTYDVGGTIEFLR